MKPICSRQLTKIKFAIAERANGTSWEKIAVKVHRRVEAVRRWPTRYADVWVKLELEADQQMSYETAKETVFILRNLFREQPVGDKIKSAALLIRLLIERQKLDLRAMQAGVLQLPEDLNSAADELENLDRHDLTPAQIKRLEKLIARAKAAAGEAAVRNGQCFDGGSGD